MPDLKPAEYDIVTIQNIDSEDFSFEYNRSAGTRPYNIKAGEVARYPRFLADHAVGKLIDQILTHKKIRTNDRAMRFKYAAKIVISEEIIVPEEMLSEGEILNKKVEELNKGSELENILSRKREGSPKDNFILPEEKEEAVDPVIKKMEEKILEHQPTTERQKLLTYAEDVMGLTMDEKLIKSFSKLSDVQLSTELGVEEGQL